MRGGGHNAGGMWALLILVLAARVLGPSPAGVPERAPTPAAASRTPEPRPAQNVPDQPYIGTPVPGEKPWEAIARAREAGVSNEALLARVRREKVVYSLTTYDMQKLRAAKVSSAVIEAMLKSGRPGTTPVPVLPAGITQTPSAPAATPVPAPR
jgi:hypothetical protein